MRVLLFLLFAVGTDNCCSAQVKSIQIVDHYTATLGWPYTINGKWVSKRKAMKVMEMDSIYESLDTLVFLEEIDLKGRILRSYYSTGPDLGDPFGEYTEYYKNGKLKVRGYYKMPPCNNHEDSLWTYFSKRGKKIGEKRFRDGLAHGRWVYYDDAGNILLEKRYKNGLSDGEWLLQTFRDRHLTAYAKRVYHNGFLHVDYDAELKFSSSLDLQENLNTYQYLIFTSDTVEFHQERKNNYYQNASFFVVRDGVKIQYKEFEDGELVELINYDYQ